MTIKEFIARTCEQRLQMKDFPLDIDFDLAVKPNEDGEIHVCLVPDQYSSRIKFKIKVD